MNKHFKQAIASLNQTNEEFRAGLISSVQHGDRREASLAAALSALAKSFGLQLTTGRFIQARGEFYIVTSEPYGRRFSDLLNSAKPRCGVWGIAILTPTATWCWVNHFEVERMVQGYYARESAKPSARRQLARRLRSLFPTALSVA